MTKSYYELKTESANFITFLKKNNIFACVDETSFRDYSVKIINMLEKTVILYHKPSKNSFSIGTHEIKDAAVKSQIEELWHKYKYPEEQDIQGLCAYVDGSFYKDVIGWGLVLVENNQIIDTKNGILTLSVEEGSRQIAGEIQAVLEALSYAENNYLSSITVFYDYIGLQKWACNEWKAQSQIAQYYKAKLLQNKVRITWKKVKAHSGNKFNEIADQLAKKRI